MIALYRPDALVVGTRGQGGIRTWGAALTGGMGSVSKCVHLPAHVAMLRAWRALSYRLQILFESVAGACHRRAVRPTQRGRPSCCADSA